MKQPEIITSLKAFASWLRGSEIPGKKDIVYGRIIEPKTLVVYDQPSVNYALLPWGKGSSEKFHLSPIRLPQANEAEHWWKDLWNGEIVDFRTLLNPPFLVFCVSKAAIWAALPDLHLTTRKAEFKSISNDSFRKLVGADLAKAMIREQSELGISVRSIIHESR